MKKNSTGYDLPAVVREGCSCKARSTKADLIVRIMRVAMIQVMVAFTFAGLAIAHPNNAQEVLNREVSLKLNEVTLEEALKEIESKVNVRFGYSRNKLNLELKVSVTASKKRLGDVLDSLLTPHMILFSVSEKGDYIILTEKKEQSYAPGEDILSTITGRVTDKNEVPLPGVNVVVKGSPRGTTTDADGKYVIDVNEGDVLMFSFIGYKKYEVLIANQTTVDLTMDDDVTTLSEVIVNGSYSTGYQVLPKERATGSYSKPTMEVFKNRTSTLDVMGRLEGQVAGLTLNMGTDSYTANPDTGNGKTSKKALVRGRSSISQSTEPLYVLNGVAVTDYADINPDDIADITVLKDAAASAIWGARAANGVIVVTTKSGKKDGEMKVSYSAFINIQGKPDYSYSRMMSSKQYIQAAKETFDPLAYPWGSLTYEDIAPHEKILYDQYRGLISSDNANSSLDSLAAINNEGQIKDIYRRAFTSNHTISISGGGSVYSFYSSISYADAHSNTPGDKNNEYRINFNQDFSPNKNIKISLSTNLNKTVSSGQNSFSVNNSFLPYQLFKDAQGNPVNMDYLSGWSDSLRQDYQARSRVNLNYNPLNEWKYKHTETNNIGINMVGNVGIRLWKGLSYLGTYGYAVAPGEFTTYEDYKTLLMRKRLVGLTVAPTPDDIPVYYLPTTGGQYSRFQSNQRDWTVRNQLTYIAAPRDKKDNLTVQVGQEARESLSSRNSITLEGYDEALQTYTQLDYNLLSLGIPGTVTGGDGYYDRLADQSEKKMRFVSYFALVNYTLNQKYSIDISWRQDQSNLFGSDKSSQNKPIWSIGSKWQLSQENFLKSTSAWLNDLGLRATYGLTGNSPFAGLATSQDVLTVSDPFSPGISGPSLVVASSANRTLKWESTETINIGIDFALYESRITGGINLYHKRTRDLIGNVTLNPFTGQSAGLGNLGHLVNQGIELQLATSNLTIKDFNWSTGFVFSYNRSELKAYTSRSANDKTADGKISRGYWEGYPMDPLFAYKWAGLDNMGDPQIRLADNTVTKEQNVAISDDVRYMGTTTPVFNGGISNTFKYKGWDLSLNLVYSLGHVMRKDVNQFYTGRMTASSWTGNLTTNFEDRWQKPGDENTTNVPSYVAGYDSYNRRNTQYYTQADINVVCASYAKFRDITLSYTLPSKLLNTLGIEDVRIFVQATNFMIWKANKDGIDPELQNFIFGTRESRFGHDLSIGLNASF